ncbi:hypothetical protein JW899_03770 [Candidatus Uhrbacteria bacterium]|nr:hypothetical protein [Candidatus Uhrbacteria bacterium]
MTVGWKRGLAGLSGPIVGLGLALAFVLGWWVMPSPLMRVWGYAAVSGLTVALVAATFIFGSGRPDAERVRLCLPPVFLAASAAAWLSLVESLSGKVAVILVTTLLVGSYRFQVSSSGQVPDGEREITESGPRMVSAGNSAGILERHPGLSQAAFVTDIFSVFFLMSFLFGLGGFRDVSMLVSAVLTGGLWGLLAHENFWRIGFGDRDRRVMGAIFSLVGLEVGFGLSCLPISYLTRSVLGVLILSFGIHLTGQVVMGTVETRRFREAVAAVLSLMAILLLTANWN